MQISPFKASFPLWEKLPSTEDYFLSVKEKYTKMAGQGLFRPATEPAFYIYQIRTPSRYHTALITCVDVREYLQGHICRHEHTLEPKERKQLDLLRYRQAAVKPVTLAYPDVEPINLLLREYSTRIEPDFTIKYGADTHLIWAVEEQVGINKLQSLFEENVPSAYIADGHHRSAATARQFLEAGEDERFSQLLCAFFPASELEIYDFNRVVLDIGGQSHASFLARLSQVLYVRPLGQARKPQDKFILLLYMGEEWFELAWKEEVLSAYVHQDVVLDAQLLNQYVFKDILDIEDVRNDPRLSYVEGPRGLDALRQKVDKDSANRVAFGLYPVQLAEMFAVADSGEELPPKSTWFAPRIKNGLIVLTYPEHPGEANGI